MNRKQKLQKLLKVLTPDNTLPDFSVFDAQINELKTKLKDKVTVKTLEEVNIQLDKFKKKIDLQPLFDSLAQVEADFKENIQSLYDELEAKTAELSVADETRTKTIKSSVADLQAQITEAEVSFKSDLKKIKKSIPDLTDLEDRVSELTIDLETRLSLLENVEPQEIKDWTDTIEKLRRELMSRINNIGGGAMNRQMFIGGVDPLTRYTDVNFKAGTGMTITYANNDTTKKVDITFSSSGGGGGTVRSISSITISQTAAAASGTDYVYLCSGTLTLTMPTTVSNTNLYTIKNIGAGIVTVNTTGGEVIDGQLTQVMPIQFTSIDLISNNSGNWEIT